MELTVSLAVITIIGSVCGIAGYFLMRRKFMAALELGEQREAELARRAYETAVLKEIGERIGYSLDASKIIEIISASLTNLIPFSTVSHMEFYKSEEKIKFEVHVNEVVSKKFIEEVKVKMLVAFSEMLQEPLKDIDLDERITGKILDGSENSQLRSFFNLPISISGRVVGIINIASTTQDQYKDEETEVLYRIARQASEAVSRLQEVLENEKGKLVQAVESLSDGILMVDVNYQVILANRKLKNLLGIVDSPKIFDIVNALSGKFDLRSKMEEALARQGPLPFEEIVVKDKILQVSASSVLDKRSNKPIGVAVLFHDITDTRSLEKLRQDFMAVMVHELRSPLTSIKSTVEFLQSEDLSKLKEAELKDYFANIDLTSQTMLELVNDLLDVAKLEAGKFEVVCEPCSLAEIINDRIEAFKLMASEKKLNISAEVEKDLPLAWFDKLRIRQVFNNLISNAIKYTESGEIKIKAALETINGAPVDIVVSVSDTGMGIDADEIKKLFARYNQLEAGIKKTGNKSSGLGLFIAKGIVEASGGKIWAESEGAGMGSTFYFTVGLASGEGKIKTGGKEKDMPESVSSIRSFSTQKVGRA